MNKEEAIEKLLEFVNSLGSEDKSVSLNDSLFEKLRVENESIPIGKIDGNRFIATKGDKGVFIFYNSYVGYYSYDFAFYRNFPRNKTTGYSLQKFKRGIYNWETDYQGKDKDGKLIKYYPWAVPEATYDITDLVMGNKQMSLMNWKRPPF